MATELGIPGDLKEACALLIRDPLDTKNIDVGQFDDHYFIVGISLGLRRISSRIRSARPRIGWVSSPTFFPRRSDEED